MPIVNGKYKNPGWVDNTQPPINAQNLNDISDTLEKLDQTAGGGVASFNGRTGAVTPQAGDYTAADVGARPNTWMPTAADVGAVPTSRTINGKPLSQNVILTPEDLGISSANFVIAYTLSHTFTSAAEKFYLSSFPATVAKGGSWTSVAPCFIGVKTTHEIPAGQSTIFNYYLEGSSSVKVFSEGGSGTGGVKSVGTISLTRGVYTVGGGDALNYEVTGRDATGYSLYVQSTGGAGTITAVIYMYGPFQNQ